jgi:hypothetical protein
VVKKPLMLQKDIIEYAEGLFKRQNLVTQQVMLLDDELSIKDELIVSEAELQMHEKCHLLNEMANHEMAGDEVSLYYKGLVQRSFHTCDEQVKKLELILQQKYSY